jgi:hypothetical protein
VQNARSSGSEGVSSVGLSETVREAVSEVMGPAVWMTSERLSESDTAVVWVQSERLSEITATLSPADGVCNVGLVVLRLCCKSCWMC